MTTRDEFAEGRAKNLPTTEQQLYESFRRLGMEPAAALAATAGHDQLSSEDPVDELTERFERLGLSRDAAWTAAVGRGGTEHEVREALGGRRTREAGRAPILRGDFSGPLTPDEKEFQQSLSGQERARLARTAEHLAQRFGLAKTYGAAAFRVAENRLLKAVYQQMKEE